MLYAKKVGVNTLLWILKTSDPIGQATIQKDYKSKGRDDCKFLIATNPYRPLG
jgi:hypothetical protein